MSDESKFLQLAGLIEDQIADNEADMQAASPGSEDYYTALGAYSAAKVLRESATAISGNDEVANQFDMILAAHERLLTRVEALSTLYSEFWKYLLANGDPARHNASAIPALPLIHATNISLVTMLATPTPDGAVMLEHSMKDTQAYLDYIRNYIENDRKPPSRRVH